MDAFESQLKAAFAESAYPVDDGFTVAVGRKVARRENQAKWAAIAFNVTIVVAGLAVAFGVYQLLSAYGQQFLASFGLEIARAHGALNQGESVEALGQSALQGVMGIGLTQILLFVTAAAGGLVAIRNARD
jgi:hypothetical protein